MNKNFSVLLALPWYHPKIHKGISRFAATHNWHVNSERVLRHDFEGDWSGDGVITQAAWVKEVDNFLERIEAPKVTLSPVQYKKSVPKIYDPDDHVAEVAVKYFLGKGFESFAIYRRNPDHMHGRLSSFASCLSDQGFLAYDLCPSEYIFSSIERLEWLSGALKSLTFPCAIFASSDNIAAELIQASVMAGIHVPQDLAILGVHNDELVCESTAISLSSVDCGLEALGYQAAKTLHTLMIGEDVPEEDVLIEVARVVTRASTDIHAIESEPLQLALNFIEQHYSEGIKNEDLAQVARISKTSLISLFKKELKLSPASYLRQFRLDKAQDLLRKTKLTVEYISFKTGFKEERTFYRAFKKEFGQSPKEYRESTKSK